MDQPTVLLLTAVFGSGGVTGACGQWVALKREKAAHKKWKDDMERRLSKVEDESPTALIKRFDEVESVREEDKREFYRVIASLRMALRNALEALGEIQTKLKIPTV